jgi:hypothetical protein
LVPVTVDLDNDLLCLLLLLLLLRRRRRYGCARPNRVRLLLLLLLRRRRSVVSSEQIESHLRDGFNHVGHVGRRLSVVGPQTIRVVPFQIRVGLLFP